MERVENFLLPRPNLGLKRLNHFEESWLPLTTFLKVKKETGVPILV